MEPPELLDESAWETHSRSRIGYDSGLSVAPHSGNPHLGTIRPIHARRHQRAYCLILWMIRVNVEGCEQKSLAARRMTAVAGLHSHKYGINLC
jgi:hypothetical protein